MATKKLGNLIKAARTDAGLTQEQLAKKVSGITASDISKAERGEKDLTADQLKAIAKATGVTQKSLLDAAGKSTAAASKTSTAKASASAKTTAKTATAKAASGKSGAASSGTSVKLTATEKKLVELYRAADADTKKRAMSVLKGESSEAAEMLKNVLGSKVIGSTISQMLKGSVK